jgi:mono/diheme cytochrome c family protein
MTLAAVAAGLALTACGRSAADLANGKKLFVGKGTCGSCHTLARAGTRGTVGPNLDHAFADARARGFKESVIEGVVRNQIAYPRKGSAMPAKLVRGDDARDVAAYVAYAAAKPGKDAGFLATVGTVNTANKSTTEKAGALTIPAEATGALAFDFGKATATAGKITFKMPNPSPIQHSIAIKGGPAGPVVGHGGTSSFTATLKPGTYEYYCTVPGHEAGGMKGTLTVK